MEIKQVHFGETLYSTPVEDLLPKVQKLIIVNSNDHLPKVFATLVKNNIYSAPVLDPERNIYLGFIDILDIVACIVEIFDEKEVLEANFDVSSMNEKGNEFATHSAHQIADLSKINPVHFIYKKAPLFEALKIFSNTRVHRIAVTDDPDHKLFINVLTQSAVVTWLLKHIDEIGPIADMSVRNLSLGLKEVVSIGSESRALEAFKLMTKNKISAVAVIEEDDGTLLTCISAKDIRACVYLFSLLQSNCTEFVAAARPSGKTGAPVIYCTLDTTFTEIIKKLSALKIHRIFVIDAHKKPLGVISLGDILAALITQGIEL